MAYESDESGQRDIWVVPFAGRGSRWQVTRAGGSAPRWSPRGDELFYVDESGNFMAARVRTSPTFAVTGVQKLFTLESTRIVFGAAPDGRSFVTTVGGRSPERIILVLNWLEEIGRAFQERRQLEAATR